MWRGIVGSVCFSKGKEKEEEEEEEDELCLA